MQVERTSETSQGRDTVEIQKWTKAEERLADEELVSGGRVSNAWVICLKVGNNYSKG